jgi:hypothetical protein
LRTWTPGVEIVCVVDVRFTSFDVFRSHCLFIFMSLAPVAVVMLTI